MHLPVCARKSWQRSKVPNVDDLSNVSASVTEDKLISKGVTREELDEIFAPFARMKRVLLAVSGGADSLALMVLCHEWLRDSELPLSLHIASVDHGLRPEAAAECAMVAAMATERGLPHETLVWKGEKSGANIQAEARAARYRLLTAHARTLSCEHIVTAHHLDDQAETFFIRLLRGSGVPGLGAMRAEQGLDDMTLLRPFLNVPKARLIASLEKRGLHWVEDPSNQSPDYLRVRVRGLLPLLAQEGCDASRLAATARRLQRADAALEAVVYEFFLRQMRTEIGHAISVEARVLYDQAEEFRLRILRKCLLYVAGPAYPPREGRLVALDGMLCEVKASGRPHKVTLSGCCFEKRDGRLWIYREAGRVPHSLSIDIGESFNWLGLYDVTLISPPAGNGGAILAALGEKGRLILGNDALYYERGLDQGYSLPVGIVEALPAIWWDGRPQWVAEWPEVGQRLGVVAEIEEKYTKSGAN